MLIRFVVENWMNFRDEVTLDMSAVDSSSLHFHQCKHIELGNEDMLPVAVVYGQNNVGKTNLLRAVKYMQDVVTGRLKGEEADAECYPRDANAPTNFEMQFATNHNGEELVYQYGFSIHEGHVISEQLMKAIGCKESYDGYTPDFVFDIDEDDEEGRYGKFAICDGDDPSGDKQIVRDWFEYDLEILFDDRDYNVGHELQYIQSVDGNFDGLVSFLYAVDNSIVKIEPDDTGLNGYCVTHKYGYTFHKGNVHQESNGIQYLIYLYEKMRAAINNGTTLVVDNLSGNLHSLVTRLLTLTFYTPESNPNYAQLIYTTHDAFQMGVLGCDEIYFIGWTYDERSQLYSLADFKDIGNMKTTQRLNSYMEGRFGAVPYLHNIDLIQKEDA